MEACIDKTLTNSCVLLFLCATAADLSSILLFHKPERWVTVLVWFIFLKKKRKYLAFFSDICDWHCGSKLWHVCQKTSCAYFVCVVIIAKGPVLGHLRSNCFFLTKEYKKTLWNILMNLPEAMLLSVTGKVWVSRPSEWSETPYLSLTSVKW